jgi:flavorubredoxin
MWRSTETMAKAIADTLAFEGVDVKPMHLRSCHKSDIITEVLDTAAIIIGSPTLNNHIFPSIGSFLTYMEGLKPAKKIAAAFGSYGWSGEAVKTINSHFETMGFDIVDPGLRVKYVPDKTGIEACQEFAKKIANAIPA